MGHSVFVIGGARSGKSSFAEGVVGAFDKPKVYIASAQAYDDEMRARIDQHQTQRGAGWKTIEAPLNVAQTLGGLSDGQAALFDCATLWLSNHMMADHDLEAQSQALLQALEACPADMVVVSNEVGQGIVPTSAMGRRFRDAQGRLNQQLAAWADAAVLVTAGLPMVLKGELP